MIICGMDISSFQLNACFLKDDESPILAAASLGRAKEQIDRLDKIGPAMRALNSRPAFDVDELVIEDAFGRSRSNDKLLWGVIGACIAQGRDQWPYARITVMRTLDWRRELGGPDTKDTKEAGHALVRNALDACAMVHGGHYANLDEHELDSIGIALAWKHRLENR